MKEVNLSRRDFIRSSSLTAAGIAGALAGQAEAGRDPVQAAIQLAGNTDSDERRLDYLKELRNRPGLDASLKDDLAKLITQIERWLGDGRLDYFGREAGRNLDFDFKIAGDSPVYPLTWLYRGRMVIWYALESGGVWNNRQRKKEYFAAARGFFEKYAEAFPKNKIVRIYLGHPTPPRKHYEAVPGAPEWALYQREGLERLTDIIEWWIDNRMQADGQYGGGWGDDCEMWRWWVPVLIGFDSPKISGAQARFSKELMSQEHMKRGYTTRMSDVEHTAEDSADAITPMMHIDPESDLWREYALKIARFMEKSWTGRNQRGFLQFKSTYFTSEKIDTNPQRACDTVYHPRVVQPTLLYWQRTGDERLTKLFAAWMDTWVDAASRAERGKPAGIIPTAIHWPGGTVGGLGSDWWDPRNHGEYTLYLYPSAMGLMTHTLLLTYHMTGEPKYLEPIRSMADIRLKYLSAPPTSQPAPGSEAWCASRLGSLSSVITKYKFLSGGTEFDELLAKEMSPYMRFRLRGDSETLIFRPAAERRSLANKFRKLHQRSPLHRPCPAISGPVHRFRGAGQTGRNDLYAQSVSFVFDGNRRSGKRRILSAQRRPLADTASQYRRARYRSEERRIWRRAVLLRYRAALDVGRVLYVRSRPVQTDRNAKGRWPNARPKLQFCSEKSEDSRFFHAAGSNALHVKDSSELTSL